MQDELPVEGQAVEVRVGNGDWQGAVYRNGRFVDRYGLSLGRRSITAWRPLERIGDAPRIESCTVGSPDPG